MSPKLRVVLEKLGRQHPEGVLRMLLAFEKAGDEANWLYCCKEHVHASDCPLDKILKDIGLSDPKAREAMRKELGLEDD